MAIIVILKLKSTAPKYAVVIVAVNVKYASIPGSMRWRPVSNVHTLPLVEKIDGLAFPSVPVIFHVITISTNASGVNQKLLLHLPYSLSLVTILLFNKYVLFSRLHRAVIS